MFTDVAKADRYKKAYTEQDSGIVFVYHILMDLLLLKERYEKWENLSMKIENFEENLLVMQSAYG